jgi:hypothetical protein
MSKQEVRKGLGILGIPIQLVLQLHLDHNPSPIKKRFFILYFIVISHRPLISKVIAITAFCGLWPVFIR